MTFEKGQSGNPTGRPRGVIDRRTGFGKHCDEDRAARIIEKALAMAEAGDIEAMKLVLPRLAPMLKPISLQMPIAVDPTLPPDRQVAGILAQLATGDLAVEDGAALIQALHRQAELDRYGVLADLLADLYVSAGKPLPHELRMRRIPAGEKQPTPIANGRAPLPEGQE